jgi:acetamidase/formamidase
MNLLLANPEESALLVAQANVVAPSRPCAERTIEVGDVLAAQLDQYPAQRRRVVDREVAATDRGFAVLVNEMKNPAVVELEVEQQPAHCESLPLRPVEAHL